MRNVISGAAALAACVGLGFGAYAAWNVNTDGIGFVGKGDVQLACGYNNKQLQENAHAVKFSFASETEYAWECHHFVHGVYNNKAKKTTTAGLAAEVQFDARQRNQVTGFILKGWSGDPAEVIDGDEPGKCPNGGDWTGPWMVGSDPDAPTPWDGAGASAGDGELKIICP